ncbi:hypothetical protein PHYBLDRAFT_64158 [Phycomyces blakesleeanus NRRL 1555(-)]|uniref:Uncharacterized protein n=1 Tax=Phycomyces blakesleeanus (strain ATCC 8743b / DSM 1359 / FGSC 10004 / NBRC 33097 / NRRL 1555) TaxID=763407 RepID=A0A162TT44_PHYB8|nr:hypothetical protein PHYBLDRAFT_64158 [Phycomyces blakesleeanus NRRL 1555(-)]OAD70762.1 hypothetical protein PHYBLDRAFT_64158 [Phycomyces blakesleeanus NRRL 1555(-)]|eukprot:XP_018288802.1 hypothetical protein PHYBLDRAFT_64158 [Phycomyces blakesleeanus NRRL 1555(-)]
MGMRGHGILGKPFNCPGILSMEQAVVVSFVCDIYWICGLSYASQKNSISQKKRLENTNGSKEHTTDRLSYAQGPSYNKLFTADMLRYLDLLSVIGTLWPIRAPYLDCSLKQNNIKRNTHMSYQYHSNVKPSSSWLGGDITFQEHNQNV